MATAPLIRKIGRAERALSPVNTAHQIDAIRTKLDEVIQALSNLNTNVTGSTTGTTLAVSYGKWTGSYSTASADGTASKSLRSDTVLVYPSALGTPTKVLTLSNDGTEGCLLTADNTFSVNAAAIKAPNATNTLRIGKYGNLAVAGTALVDTTVLSFTKNDYNEAIEVRGMNAAVTNSGAGAGGALATGVVLAAVGTAVNAGGTSTSIVTGASISTQGGSTSTNNFQGTLRGIRLTETCSSQTAGTSVAAIEGLSIGGATITRSAVTDLKQISIATSTLVLSGTITNHYGISINALTSGTNRYGINIAAFTTGTPTVSYGIQIGTHSAGTTRRAVIGGNTFESTANDFLCSTTAKGLVCKDSQGTAEYWRTYIDSTGTKGTTLTQDVNGYVNLLRTSSPTGNITINVIDTGTTAPTT